MDLTLYAVNAVLVEGRSVREVAAATGRSKSLVHRHVVVFRAGGQAALAPAKRGPKVALNQTPVSPEDAIVSLRKHLGELGLDAGASTIAYHLLANGMTPPARATIHRILVRRGFVTPQPQKRPRSSWQRFEAQPPNECWQSDMTHWQLDDDVHCEIINFIDDYSRAVLAPSPSPPPPPPTSCASSSTQPPPTAYPKACSATTAPSTPPRVPRRSHQPRDRTRRARHHLQTRQALPPPNPRQDRALPPHPQDLPPSTATRPAPHRTPNPTRPLRAALQRRTTPPSTRLPTHARLANPRQRRPNHRRPTDPRQHQSPPRQSRHHRLCHPPPPLTPSPHRDRQNSPRSTSTHPRLRPRHPSHRRRRRTTPTPHPRPNPRLPSPLEGYRLRVRLSQKLRDRTRAPSAGLEPAHTAPGAFALEAFAPWHIHGTEHRQTGVCSGQHRG